MEGSIQIIYSDTIIYRLLLCSQVSENVSTHSLSLIYCPPGLFVRGAPGTSAQPARHECALRPVCLARCYTPIYERTFSIHCFRRRIREPYPRQLLAPGNDETPGSQACGAGPGPRGDSRAVPRRTDSAAWLFSCRRFWNYCRQRLWLCCVHVDAG